MSDRPNLAPADEYCTLKDRIEADEKRVAELRQLLLSDPSARTGNHYVVEIQTITERRSDTKAMRELYPQIVDEFTFPREVKRLIPRAIDQDTGEIVPIRRKLHTLRVV